MKRFLLIHENGDISFIKMISDDGEWETTTYVTYKEKTATTLNFADECRARFAEDFPEFDSFVDEWEMIPEGDLEEFLKI